MAVDLATSAPVVLADRLVYSQGLAEEWQVAYRPGDLPLSSAVRTSASFPGLPAVRVGPPDLGAELEWTNHDMFLVDGGAWNNLGTDWEEWAQSFDRDSVLPAVIPLEVDWHIVVDASAPPRRPRFNRGTNRRRAWDWPVCPTRATFETANHALVAGARRRLHERQRNDAPVIVVDFDEFPSTITARSAFAFPGGDAQAWDRIAKLNRTVGTTAETARGLTQDEVRNLIAHSYVQTAAHLTIARVPFARFSDPWDRFDDLLG